MHRFQWSSTTALTQGKLTYKLRRISIISPPCTMYLWPNMNKNPVNRWNQKYLQLWSQVLLVVCWAHKFLWSCTYWLLHSLCLCKLKHPAININTENISPHPPSVIWVSPRSKRMNRLKSSWDEWCFHSSWDTSGAPRVVINNFDIKEMGGKEVENNHHWLQNISCTVCMTSNLH